MPNPKGNEESLVKYKPKWQSGKTKTIRVPIAIADHVLEAAKVIDKNGAYITDTSDISLTSFNKHDARLLLESMLAAPSNKGGYIKKLAAELGNLIGFEIKKKGRKWQITDTSD